jgi:tripartite-type tricarboxylate transporter receptor subunit TctC
MRVLKISLVVVMVVFLTGGLLIAAEYPLNPVEILVGFPPGGPADLSARLLAEAAKPFFPKPISVVNKVGGGGVVAVSELVKSPPNGYTLGVVTSANVAISPHLQPNLPYKGPDDLQYIISGITEKSIVAVRSDSPWKTMNDLVAYAKANPGKLRIGNPGIGTTGHIFFLSLKLCGVPMTEVPFRGAAPAAMALLGGHVEGVVASITGVLPHVKSGKLKFLALFTEERFKGAPELEGVPTLKELGYDVITEGTTFDIAAPRGTPQEIVDILYNAFLKAEQSDLFQKFSRDNFLIVPLEGPGELKEKAERRYVFYRDFLRKAGLTPQK